jgi:hypothetical protein
MVALMFTLIVLLGLAAWMATTVLVEGEIFRDFRELFDKLDTKYDNWLTNKLRYLVGCHLCTGLWVGLVIAAFIPAVASSGVVGWVLTGLAIKGVAHLFLVIQKAAESWTDWNRHEADKVELQHTFDLGDVASGKMPASFYEQFKGN